MKVETILTWYVFTHRALQTAGHHTDRDVVKNGTLKTSHTVSGGRGKDELRSWMAAKRRERLAQFLAERDRLRKREKHPFQPPPSVSKSADEDIM